jgi:flagellin-like protein
MKAKGLLKEARGISPLIATLILIAATIAGGAVVYGVMRSQMSSLGSNTNLEITYADIVVAGNENLAMVTVKNVGTVNLTGVTVTVTAENENPVLISLGDLAAGQTKSGENLAGSWIPGNTYIVRVSDSNHIVMKSTSVVAHA